MYFFNKSCITKFSYICSWQYMLNLLIKAPCYLHIKYNFGFSRNIDIPWHCGV